MIGGAFSNYDYLKNAPSILRSKALIFPPKGKRCEIQYSLQSTRPSNGLVTTQDASTMSAGVLLIFAQQHFHRNGAPGILAQGVTTADTFFPFRSGNQRDVCDGKSICRDRR